MSFTINSLGIDIMMSLGSFRFGVLTAAYQELQRVSEYRWPAQDRVGNTPQLQFVGRGADTITLPGVIYPEWNGGAGQLDRLRALADQGLPQMLVSGMGRVMGRWVIERVEEKQGPFFAGGVPRKQEFTLQLRKYDDGPKL